MRHRSFIVPSLCLGVLVVGCGHPAGSGTSNPGSGGDSSGSGGSSNPSGSGGASGGNSAGNSGTSGSAGSTDPGSGGSGGSGTGGSTGSGGTDVVVVPDGGTPPVTKAACMDDPSPKTTLKYTPGYVISDQAKTLASQAVSTMSLKDKADQLRGPITGGDYNIFHTADSALLKGFQFRDGPRGVNLDATKGNGQNGYSTAFPVAMARGAAFDIDLEYAIGQAMGDEMVAANATMLLAPTVNILRHPAWGRAQETYGEDSFLLGRLGTAFTVGVQEYVPACVKHYAANNIENGRETAIAAMDDQTLHDVYARHFGMIIQDGGVSCVMAAYNQIQIPGSPPEHCTQSKRLLTDILRTEFGFQGFVLSDWWAMPDGTTVAEAAKSGYASTAINAGLDMELPWNLNYKLLETLPGAEPLITKSALRVVTEKYRFKVNNPSGPVGLKQAKAGFNTGTYSVTNNDDHIALAQRAAIEGSVLLKNEMNTLPIKSTLKNVAVIGPTVSWSLFNGQTKGTINFASDVRTGDLGSSRVKEDPTKSTGPFAGIKAAAPAGTNVTNSNGDNAQTASAVAAADFVVIVAGLTPQDEGEEYTILPQDADRDANMGLDGKAGGTAQNSFITKYAAQAAAANKPVVVILEGGSVIDMPWLDKIPAVVMAWYPGQVGGTALGQLLFGKANFSGKLPITWPKSAADEPMFSGGSTTTMGYNLGYRWFDVQNKAPLFPFGHGLSYTTFEYSNVQVPCTTVTPKGVVKVGVDVKNSGTVAGEESVLLFVSYPGSKLAFRPAGYKEFKGFTRIALNAGETAHVTIPIRVPDLSYFDTASKTWKVEPGTVKVMVGPNASAAKLAISDTFTVQ